MQARPRSWISAVTVGYSEVEFQAAVLMLDQGRTVFQPVAGVAVVNPFNGCSFRSMNVSADNAMKVCVSGKVCQFRSKSKIMLCQRAARCFDPTADDSVVAPEQSIPKPVSSKQPVVGKSSRSFKDGGAVPIIIKLVSVNHKVPPMIFRPMLKLFCRFHTILIKHFRQQRIMSQEVVVIS